MLALQTKSTVPRAARPSVRPAPMRVSVRPKAVHMLADIAAEVGQVDAPIGVVVGGAIFVTLVGTAIIPLALNPGQEAADKMFDAKQGNPLDKRTTIRKPTNKKK